MAIDPTQVQQFLGGVDYPCSKSDLVKRARESGADQKIVTSLQSLPYDEFNSPTEVTQALSDEM